MAFPFGVSVGDFIASIKVICDGFKTLDDATGASQDYRQFSSTL
jgi:hypothetical protein